MLRWAATHGIEVPERLGVYLAQMKKLPSVERALAEEGLASPWVLSAQPPDILRR
jgi:hypothetical protein